MKNLISWLLIFLLYLSPTLSHIVQANENEVGEKAPTEEDAPANMTVNQPYYVPPFGSTPSEMEETSAEHPGELAEVPPFVKKDITLPSHIMNYIKGTSQFPKKRGTSSPHFPVSISFKPKLVPLPSNQSFPGIETAIEDGYINLYALTHNLLKQLSPEDLQELFAYLSTQKIKIHLECKGKWHVHPIDSILWDKTNAAVGVALRMGIQKKSGMFARIISLSPFENLEEIEKKAPTLLNTQVTAAVLINLAKQLNHKNTSIISQYIAGLVNKYTRYWSGKDAELMYKNLTNLILQIHTYKGNLVEFTPKQLGVLLGSLLAGSLAHCSKIKSDDIKRQWLVNSASNLIWATTTFLGVAPWFAGNVAAAIAGTISVGVVSGAVAYNILRVPRNYASMVRAVEGEIKISALDLADTGERRAKVSEMLEWIDAVIELNGQPA